VTAAASSCRPMRLSSRRRLRSRSPGLRERSANGMDRPCSGPHPWILGRIYQKEHGPCPAKRQTK
jgi:hypothetical protein